MVCGFGLINMNGRLYDPYLQRFLSPDPYVQSPGNAQSYNRYSYCMNNPLMYFDPSGYNFKSWWKENWKPIVGTAATIGIFAGSIILTGGASAVMGGIMMSVISNMASGNTDMSYTNAICTVGIGALTGAVGAGVGGWASSATKALGAIPGAAVGAATGAGTGALTGGLSQGLNRWLLGDGNFGKGFGQGALGGAITGGIMGAISGGYAGYERAKANGANLWTGSKITNSRSYFSSGYGNPASFRQLDKTRDCGAYNRGFADNTNPSDYFQYEDADGGADMAKLLRDSGSKGVAGVWSSDANLDIVGSQMNNGASVFSTAGAHNYTIIELTVSDKANLFFGGTHQVVTSSTVFNSLTGSLQCGDGVLDRITWGY